MKDIEFKITEYTKELNLPAIRNNYVSESKSALLADVSYEKFLLNLLEKEYDRRIENRLKSRLRWANFPYKKYLEDLDVAFLPKDASKKLKLLKSLDFIKTGQNVIFSGNPGTGKTHITIGLAIEACLKGYKVLFTTIPALITQLKESRSKQTLRAYQNKFEKYDLVVCDELGYISFDKEGSELLFTHLSLRAGRKSTIITTNLSFERWDELFQDPVLTAAMVDRLTHKAYLVNMNGNSYRLKESKEWVASQQ
jgi:DNA replication protein DnaC